MVREPPGSDPEVPRGPQKRKKRKNFFTENPDLPDPDPDFRINAAAMRSGGRGLPVAKISDL